MYLSTADIDALGRELKQYYPGLIADHRPTVDAHRYEPDMTAGIGFCTVCLSDFENDGNHIVEAW